MSMKHADIPESTLPLRAAMAVGQRERVSTVCGSQAGLWTAWSRQSTLTIGSKGRIGSEASTSGRLYYWTLQPTVDCGLCPSTNSQLFIVPVD
eukprot:1190739-Prorocentrum_minimum.AAC.2